MAPSTLTALKTSWYLVLNHTHADGHGQDTWSSIIAAQEQRAALSLAWASIIPFTSTCGRILS